MPEPKRGKAAHPALFTAFYWFFALLLLMMLQVGDCFEAADVCKASRQASTLRVLAFEFVLYLGLLVVLLRNRR